MKSIIVMIVVLSGCAEISPHQFTGPDGGKAFSVSCNEMSDCYEKIGDSCGGKYKIVNVTSNNASFPKGSEVVFVFHHNLAVECVD